LCRFRGGRKQRAGRGCASKTRKQRRQRVSHRDRWRRAIHPPNLPAGDYEVEVRKEGFFLLSGQSFSLHADRNELTLTLNHVQELHEQVQVTAPSNQIDTQDTSQRSTLSSQNIRDIPVPNSHVLAESLVALPEIVRDSRSNLHIAGARSGETQYLLDGFEIGDAVNGALTARFNIDATRAAEVQTGRFGAGLCPLRRGHSQS
jgi:hypothetical protein